MIRFDSVLLHDDGCVYGERVVEQQVESMDDNDATAGYAVSGWLVNDGLDDKMLQILMFLDRCSLNVYPMYWGQDGRSRR